MKSLNLCYLSRSPLPAGMNVRNDLLGLSIVLPAAAETGGLVTSLCLRLSEIPINQLIDDGPQRSLLFQCTLLERQMSTLGNLNDQLGQNSTSLGMSCNIVKSIEQLGATVHNARRR
jgi:hypothetical protein